MRRHSLAVAIFAIPLVVAGCASSAGRGTVGGGTPAPEPRLPAGLVVFQVETAGGFVPIEYELGGQPTLTIYGDGTAFTTVEEDTHSPVVALRQGSVPAHRLSELIAAAGSSELFGDVDYGMPGVTDLGTTTLTFRPHEGARLTASAYALGFDDGDDTSGLSEAQQERRHALSALIKGLLESVTYPAGGGVWTPNHVQMIALADTPSNERNATPWPGPDLAALLTRNTDYGPCGELVDADAARGFNAARVATSSTWTDRSKTYHLLVRALLPGETPCTR